MISPSRLLVLLAISALLLAGCSSGSDGSSASDGQKFSDVVVLDPDIEIQPVITNSELVVGRNRFGLGLIDAKVGPIVDAKVHLAFYKLGDGQETLMSETDAMVIVPARDAGIKEQIVHIHADGSRHIHVNAGENVGIYIAQVDFDSPGAWGVEIGLETDGVAGIDQTLQSRFTVQAEDSVPGPGDPAPASHNLTAADVEDLSIIDTSQEPTKDMHTETIADAIVSGKPTVVLFAAPGYCTSSMCGPEYEILHKLYQDYKDRAQIIHVEFYENPSSPDREPVEAASEWNLQTEPWFFVIDSNGIVTARFEGPTSLQELIDALLPLLS